MEENNPIIIKTKKPNEIAGRIINSKLLIPLVILLNLILAIPLFNKPPFSVHAWRQCHTLAVARNMYTEELNIFETRVDNRYESNGITGSHFPLYEFILALIYKVTGERIYIHRILSFIIYIIGGFGLSKLILKISGKELAAKIALYSYLFSPELFYHKINALPDILALTLSIWSFYFYLKWFESIKSNNPNSAYYFVTIVLTILTGLTKLQYLAIGFPILGYSIYNIKKNFTKTIWAKLGIYGICSAVIPVYWYVRAAEIIKNSGLKDFGIEFRPELKIKKAIELIIQNVFSTIPETVLNFASTFLLLVGVYYIFKTDRKINVWYYPFLIYIISLIVYHLVELSQMDVHSYYMMPYYIPLLLITGMGGYYLMQRGKLIFLCILLFLQPILAVIRIYPRYFREDKGIPKELFDGYTRNKLANLTPKDEKVLMGPDISQCIFFYLLNKKGYGFSNVDELINKNNGRPSLLENAISDDVKYIYYFNRFKDLPIELGPYTDKIIYNKGEFVVIRLKKNRNNS